MNRITIPVCVSLFIVFSGLGFAQELIPISAEDAFEAVQTQTDPITGEEAKVALIDVRTRAEYFWVGAACQVDKIETTKGKVYYPDLGKVLLSRSGRFIDFDLNGRFRRLQVRKVSKIVLSPIAKNIPFRLWVDDPPAGAFFLKPNPDFAYDVNALADDGFNVLIFFCGNGGRSSLCFEIGGFDKSFFEKFYEIDQPDGTGGKGGFQGPEYLNVYNGYQGFPERLTEIQEHPSVSWKDTGLPIQVFRNPLAD